MQGNSELHIQILVVTHGRERLLERLLTDLKRGLLAATHRYRVKVVVNGPDSASTEILERSGLEELDVQHVPKPLSPSAARAEGLRQVLPCDWIWFLDDDVLVPEKTFRRLEMLLGDESSAVDIWGGPNLTPPDSSWKQKVVGALLENPFAVGPVSQRYRSTPTSARILSDDRSLMLCHLLVRAELVDRALFLPGLLCGEENYFLAVLKSAGARMAFHSEISVLHERRPAFRSFLAQIQKYGLGRGQLVRELGPFRMGWFTWGFGAVLVCLLLSISFAPEVLLGIYLSILGIAIFHLAKHSALGWRSLIVAAFLVPALQARYLRGLFQGWARGLDET